MHKMVNAVKNWATNVLNLALVLQTLVCPSHSFLLIKWKVVLVLLFRGILSVSLVVLVKLGVFHIAIFVLLKM